MVSSNLIDNYKLSLEQKYNAVCFDIDGTLTETNSKSIDKRAIQMIADLLKRKVPVVFITGRGETGLNDLKTDIFEALKNKFNISNVEFSRMYVLTNDGARLFFTIKDDKDDILKHNVYISTKSELDELNKFNDNIIRYLKENSLHNFCDITYSKDLKTGIILNIRIVFESDNDKLINCIFDIIDDIVKNNNLNNICITRGLYRSKNVIQIGTAKKEKAIERAEKIIGVPKKSMIRIGDCGDIRGNDYSMLNCEQGYSVDKTSDSVDSCFPVIDDNGQVLKGIDATLYLVSKAKILPTICLESAPKKDYIYKYASVEQQIIKGRNEHLKIYNEIINKNFNLMNGIYDLFDEFSGSIKIPMYEWELIKNNPLKDLWNTGESDKLFYSIRDDNNYLLRGSKTYYYFLSNRQSINNEDITTLNDVLKWYSNYLQFFNNAYNAIYNTLDFSSYTNKKLVIGLADNMRNALLVMINHKLNNIYLNQNILINLKYDNTLNLYQILYSVEELMSKICFSQNYNISKNQILSILKKMYDLLFSDYLDMKKNIADKDYSKEFRAYREIDNFAENYITLRLNQEKCSLEDTFSVCGMCYGGIELPILYKVIEKNVDDVLILKFNNLVSGYANKQLVDLRKFNINNYGGLLNIGKIENSNIVLLDDNVLTGKTMQLAINCLYDYKFNIKNINIVRYPSINRVDQMFMNNHGAVDYNLFFDYITGLCFHSPYSWRDENDLNPYEDSLGVFDLNRKKIIECLIKNHDFKEKSEVAEYKRRIKR